MVFNFYVHKENIMRILPVSRYAQNKYDSNQYSFNGKLSDQLVVTVNLAAKRKIQNVGRQYNLNGEKLTQDIIDNVKEMKSDTLNKLKTFISHFHDDFQLKLVGKVNKDTGEKNIFFALTHPKVPDKYEQVCIVDYDAQSPLSLDDMHDAADCMLRDNLCYSYIENVHRHFGNSILDNAVNEVKNNYKSGLIEELTTYISEFSQFTRSGYNNYDYVKNLLKAVHSEQTAKNRYQTQLDLNARKNTRLVNKNLRSK